MNIWMKERVPEPMRTRNAEDYLERIHELIQRKGYARVTDIASALGVRRSTVSMMLGRLSRQDLVKLEKYRGLALTPKGLEIARRIERRHVTLTEFLILLDIDRDVVARDVEGIEHHISQETLEKIERLIKQWREKPEALSAAIASKATKHALKSAICGRPVALKRESSSPKEVS